MATRIIHPMNAEGDGTLVDNTKVVTHLMLSEEHAVKKKFSEEDLQNEFDFYMAEKLSKMMLEKGLLSEEECTKLSVKNRETFSPYLCSIMSKSA